MTLEQLLDLRPKTDSIAHLLRERLARHLETIRPLLDPARVLGKASGASRIAWMDKSLTEFKTLYQKYGGPFRLPVEFDFESLEDAGARLDLTPWEYTYEIAAEREKRQVAVTSPTRWIVSFGSEYSPERMKTAVSNREPGQPANIQRFVIHALLLMLVFQKSPKLIELLRALRFEIETVPVPELHGLPLVTIRFALPSYRPEDTLILKATGLSGVPAFNELVDLDAIRSMPDNLKLELEALIS